METIYYLLLAFGVLAVFLVMVVILVIVIKKSIDNGADPNDL
jgi:hypothetical protein